MATSFGRFPNSTVFSLSNPPFVYQLHRPDFSMYSVSYVIWRNGPHLAFLQTWHQTPNLPTLFTTIPPRGFSCHSSDSRHACNSLFGEHVRNGSEDIGPTMPGAAVPMHQSDREPHMYAPRHCALRATNGNMAMGQHRFHPAWHRS